MPQHQLLTSRLRVLSAAILSVATLFVPAIIRAAPIMWGVPKNITGDADVSTNGTLVGAAVLTTRVQTVVNGVTFARWDVATSSTSGIFSVPTLSFRLDYTADPAPAPYGNLSVSYQNLLRDAGSFNGKTLTISGLTSGETYEFQWWSNYSTDTVETSMAGNTLTLSLNTTGIAGGLGQFGIGAFVADGATQDISFGGVGLVNAVQVRRTSQSILTPDGGTILTIMGIALAGLTVAARKSSKASGRFERGA